MKKMILTAASLVILTTAGFGYIAKANTESTLNETPHTAPTPIVESDEVSTMDHMQDDQEANHEFAEYTYLQNFMDAESLSIHVIEDNKNKRVILLEDTKGKPKYKSVFVKKKAYLKVVDFKAGVVVNERLHDAVQPSHQDQDEVEGNQSFEEFATIGNYVDLTNLTPQVAKDNKGKRVILLKDANGKTQYKSIYVKKKNHLKVIDLQGGLIFKGSI